MNSAIYKYISTIKFSELYNWSFQYTTKYEHPFTDKYKRVKIGTFLTRIKDMIDIENDKTYKRVSIKLYNGGVFLRDIEKGINIGTKKQFRIKEGDILLSKIDARNGAIGVVPKVCDNAIITGNFWTFEVNTEIVIPLFLSILMRTNYFIRLFDNASNGTTNRHYLQEDLFLNTEIPLPSIKEQMKILEKYNNRIKLAEKQDNEILNLEKQIQDFLLNSLGITILNNDEKKDNNYLKVVELKDLYRWDIFSQNSSIENILNKSKFPLKRLGKEYNFINRAWNKKEYKKKQFFYIELGDIDPIIGITSAKELNVEKAPSRATQIIKNKDLIIGTTRPYLKKFAIVDNKYDSCICSSGFSVIEDSSKYNLSFLKEYLMSSIGTEQLKNNMSGGLYPAITTEKFKNIKIPIPPLDIQNKIVYQIDIIRNKIKQLKKDIDQNKMLAQKEFEMEIFK